MAHQGEPPVGGSAGDVARGEQRFEPCGSGLGRQELEAEPGGEVQRMAGVQAFERGGYERRFDPVWLQASEGEKPFFEEEFDLAAQPVAQERDAQRLGERRFQGEQETVLRFPPQQHERGYAPFGREERCPAGFADGQGAYVVRQEIVQQGGGVWPFCLQNGQRRQRHDAEGVLWRRRSEHFVAGGAAAVLGEGFGELGSQGHRNDRRTELLTQSL